MSKITLTDVKGGFNLTAIQSNFDAIATELQGSVLYRNNPVGEPNTLETDLDMNNKRILNLPAPIGDNEPLRKGDAGSLSSLIASAAGYASTASIKADEAEASALAAAASAASADADAIAAAASAVAAEDSSRLTVGTTTTGAPGSSAIVSITGSPGAQALNLTIPRGDVGATGAGITPQAVGFTVTGGTTPKTLTVALDANVSGTNTGDNAVNTLYSGLAASKQDVSAKDATGGYAGLTLFKLNMRNVANTFTSWFTNTNTAARTYTLPDADGTIADLASAQAFTNKSYNGMTLTSTTGVFTLTAGKTLAATNTLTLSGTDGTVMTFPPASASVGYLNIPQNSQSTAYTLVLADAGKHILHPSADTTARTMTIPANSSVAYPVGTAITFVNQASAGVMTIAITTDTMRLAGAGTTGSRTLAANGVATALKLTATEWLISGTGLT